MSTLPTQGSFIWVKWEVMWDISIPDSSNPDYSWFRALVLNIHDVKSKDPKCLSGGTIQYVETESFESCAYTVRFLRGSLLSHVGSLHGTDNTPCPWEPESTDDDEYLPDVANDSDPSHIPGSSNPGVNVQEALLDHARSIETLTTRLNHLQSVHTPVVTTVGTGWFRDFAFYSLVHELNKSIGSLGRRAQHPGLSKTPGRQQPFYGLLRTVVSVSLPCPFPVFCDIIKSHGAVSGMKTYDNPEFFPSYNSYLLPCNHKNRYVVGFSSFFAVCAALSQLDTKETSTFLVRQNPSSTITRVLGTLVRNPSDSLASLHIVPGYTWDGVLPHAEPGSPDPDYVSSHGSLETVISLDLATTVVKEANLLFKHRFARGSRHVSTTTAGDITQEAFKHNTFSMEWIPPVPLPRGFAHLPVLNKSDLGVLQINLPAVAISRPELRAEVDAILTPAIVSIIAKSSSQ